MTDIERLIDAADSFGEVDVIRAVAIRAGLLWQCVCGTDNTRTATCDSCTRPEPENPRSNLVGRVSAG